MIRPNNVRILADDLTGALDTAAQFVPMLRELTVSWSIYPVDRPGSAFDAETRNLTAHDAGERTGSAARWLSQAQIAYKKVDSQLRGHPAIEIATAYSAGQFTHAVIAPAFPAQRRRTHGGRQWIRDCDAADWRAVGPDLGSAFSSLGLTATIASSSQATDIRPGLTICDAETDADLDRIVAAAAGLTGRVLWCGAAGLAAALARRHCGRNDVRACNTLPAPLLFVIGTARPAMLTQIDHLNAASPACWIRAGRDTSRTAQRLREVLEQTGFALLSFVLDDGLSEAAAAKIIAKRMANLFGNLKPPGSLFVSGGETLHAALDILDVNEICVDGKFSEGIPLGRLAGGQYDGVRLISKSGAFGAPDILNRIAESVVST